MNNVDKLENQIGAHLLTLSPEEKSFLHKSETFKSDSKQPSFKAFMTSSSLAVLSDQVHDIIKESPLLIKGK